MDKKIYSLLKESERFGFKKQVDGTLFFGHVPHVAPEAWFHILFSPLDGENFKALRKGLEQDIPSDYANFLKTHNGMMLFSTSLSLYGYRKNYNRTSNIIMPFDLCTANSFDRPVGALETHFFFGGYNWDGSLLYMEQGSQRVFRRSSDGLKPLNVWDSLAVMLSEEVVRLDSLFKDGKKINRKKTTP